MNLTILGEEAVKKAVRAVAPRPRAIQRYTFFKKTFCLTSTFVNIVSLFIFNSFPKYNKKNIGEKSQNIKYKSYTQFLPIYLYYCWRHICWKSETKLHPLPSWVMMEQNIHWKATKEKKSYSISIPRTIRQDAQRKPAPLGIGRRNSLR